MARRKPQKNGSSFVPVPSDSLGRIIYIIERIGIAGAIVGYLLYQLPKMTEVLSKLENSVHQNTRVSEKTADALESVADELRDHRTRTELNLTLPRLPPRHKNGDDEEIEE